MRMNVSRRGGTDAPKRTENAHKQRRTAQATQNAPTPQQARTAPANASQGASSGKPPIPKRGAPERKVIDAEGRVWIYDSVSEDYYQVEELPGMDEETREELLKVGAGNVTTLEAWSKYVQLDESFDVDDLQGMADRFLGNLRTPPSKKRMEEFRRDREEKKRRLRDEGKL